MLAQEIPGPQHLYEDEHGLIDFVPGASSVKKTDNESCEGHINIAMEQ